MAHTPPIIPSRIAAWQERFRNGAAQAYTGRWYLIGDEVRVDVPLVSDDPDPDTEIVVCCPLTAQQAWECKPAEPVPAESIDDIAGDISLGLRQLEHVVAAADNFRCDDALRYRPLSPLERAIRAALLAAVHLSEEK